MSRHRSPSQHTARTVVTVVIAVAAVVTVAALLLRNPSGSSADETTAQAPATSQCDSTLHVVTASSFAPVLDDLASNLAAGDRCVSLRVDVADGRSAADRVAELGAHVWIPDDAAWAGTAAGDLLAEPETAGSGTLLATSPIYMIADQPTAQRVEQAGGSWLALADLAATGSGVRIAVRDPAGSGDGLIAAGSVGEAVWIERGMDESAKALASALPAIRTVPGADPALPQPGEVGLVPEYALLNTLAAQEGGGADAELAATTILPGSDYRAQLRYTWLPTAAAAADPAVQPLLTRTLEALTGADAAEPLAAASLRRPAAGAPPGAPTDRLPTEFAEPFDVLGGHHVDHVFATWYPDDRKGDLLLVIDVSGSMAEPPEGSTTPLIDLVRDGVRAVGEILPDDAELSLWEFGSRIDGDLDYRNMLGRQALDAGHRQALRAAVDGLATRGTGTGLYDTIVAAYASGRDGYRKGIPNHVIVFTDGRNEDDPNSISVEELTARLIELNDPARPVILTIMTFGPEPEAELLATAVEPVDGYVEELSRPDEVYATMIHQTAGGLHH
jgi:hypothetical protein